MCYMCPIFPCVHTSSSVGRVQRRSDGWSENNIIQRYIQAAVQRIGKPYYYSDYIRVFTVRKHVWFNNNSNVYDITRPRCAANGIRISYKYSRGVPRVPPFGGYKERDALRKVFFLSSVTLKYIGLYSLLDDARHGTDEIYRRRHPKRQTCYRGEFLTTTLVLHKTFLPRPQ